MAPSTDELIYATHPRGFALHSLRSPTITRLYLQVPNDEDLAAWRDDRIWSELRLRLGRDDGWTLADGPIFDRSITPMRGFVSSRCSTGACSSPATPPTSSRRPGRRA